MSRKFVQDEPVKKSFDTESRSQKSKLPISAFTLSKLPSKGLPYPENVTISYRPYTFSEVKKVSDSKLTEKQMYEFIMNGIYVEGMDTDELTLGDANYLALYRKLSVLGQNSSLKVIHPCANCGTKNEKVIKIAELNPQFISAPDLPACAHIMDTKFGFEPLTISDYFKLDEMISTGEYDEDFATWAMMCTTHEFDEVYDSLDNMYSVDEMDNLEKIDKYLNHGIKNYKMKCKNADEKGEDFCDHVTEVRLDGGQAVLLPFREPAGTHGDGISFGS